MANSKSAKKRVLQSEKRRVNNCARRSAIKTAVKKVLAAIETSADNVEALFVEAQAKIARAKGKHLFHANTAARKISRLAKRVNAAKAATN